MFYHMCLPVALPGIVNIKLNLKTSPQVPLRLTVMRASRGHFDNRSSNLPSNSNAAFFSRNIPENSDICFTVFKVTAHAVKCLKDELRVDLKLMLTKGKVQSE